MGHHELAGLARGNEILGEPALVVEGGVGLGDDVVFFLQRGQITDPVRDPAVPDLPIGGLDEAELVDPRVGGQGGDEADIRTLGRLDGTDPAVMRRVDVAHLKARPLPGQAARAQGREPALVGDLGQGIGLVQKLRQLARPEELLQGRGNRLVVDQLLRHQRVDVLEAHLLLDGSFHAHEADTEMVLHQLANGPHPAVAQVVDIVHGAVAVAQLDEVAHHLEDVLLAELAVLQGNVQLEPVIELQPPDPRQIVAVRTEEQVVEEGGGRIHGGRIAGAQTPVDLQQRLVAGLHLVLQQRVPQVGAGVRVIEKEQVQLLDPAAADVVQLLLGDGLVALEDDLVRVRIDDVVSRHPAQDVLPGDGDPLDPRAIHLAQHRAREAASLPHDEIVAFRIPDVASGLQAHELAGLDLEHRFLDVAHHRVGLVEIVQQLLGLHPQGAQQHGDVELPPPVDANEQDVPRIELEIQPRAAVRDDPGRVQELSAGVGLPLVVLEEHPGRAVELTHDHPLGAVDHEGAVPGHQRHLAEVDLLLLHVADAARAGLGVDVPKHELDRDLERRGEVHAPFMALVDVVLGLPQRVADVLQRSRVVKVPDGENGLEYRL